jgi:dimethylhistidine N-methyltransferase
MPIFCQKNNNVVRTSNIQRKSMTAAKASPCIDLEFAVELDPVAEAVRLGLSSCPRRLPPWLFYDAIGSRLFEAITDLNEYYLTRTERSILARHASEMISTAADGARLRIAELGAGSAEKTRLLLRAALEQQRRVTYEPIDVSVTALEQARELIELEIPGVDVFPCVADYTRGNGHALELEPAAEGDRRLVLYIGSSIGNFDPPEASSLLRRMRASLAPGDCLLLGVDLVKDRSILLKAYDDTAGITAAFNRNMLSRLNRELGANFDPTEFLHVARWNESESRIEMHLASRCRQEVRIAALDRCYDFARGETIHTESSYKYEVGQAEAMLERAGFEIAGGWTDPRGWFSVTLARAD